MGQQYSTYLKQAKASGRLNDLEYQLELLIKAEIEKAKQRKERARSRSRHKSRLAAQLGGDCLLSGIVTADNECHLLSAKQHADGILAQYLKRALSVPLELERAKYDLPHVGRSYDMPHVIGRELFHPKEAFQIRSSYVSSKHVDKRALEERKAFVRAARRPEEPMLISDAEGFPSAVHAPGWWRRHERLGQRVALLLHLRRNGAGYMMECQGSGAVEADRLRSALRYPERVAAWGKPKHASFTRIRTTGTEKKPEHNAVKLVYKHSEGKRAGKEVSWQAGAWLWREEFEIEGLQRRLVCEGLGAYADALSAYLARAEELLKLFGPLLIVHGRESVHELDLPAAVDGTPGQLRDLYDKLSMNVIDSYGDSKFGAHRDTSQLPPCAPAPPNRDPACMPLPLCCAAYAQLRDLQLQRVRGRLQRHRGCGAAADQRRHTHRVGPHRCRAAGWPPRVAHSAAHAPRHVAAAAAHAARVVRPLDVRRREVPVPH